MAEPQAPACGAFERDTAVRALDGAGSAGCFEAHVSPAWRAGRGPHGGYLTAIMLRALLASVRDSERAPRSLTVHFARAPRPGPVLVHTTLEREGRSLSTLSARMEQDGELIALGLSAFSVRWRAPELADASMPALAPPDEQREAGTLLRFGAPPFTEHLIVQPRLGAAPFGGSPGPMELAAWVGLAEPRPLDAISLAFFSDALFSPPFLRLTERATSPTIDLTIHFRARLPRAPDADPHELCLARFRTTVVHEGFFEEDGAIWAQDGTLLAQSRQLAILMPLAIG